MPACFGLAVQLLDCTNNANDQCGTPCLKSGPLHMTSVPKGARTLFVLPNGYTVDCDACPVVQGRVGGHGLGHSASGDWHTALSHCVLLPRSHQAGPISHAVVAAVSFWDHDHQIEIDLLAARPVRISIQAGRRGRYWE